MNSRQNNINFTKEFEENNSLSFLDVLVFSNVDTLVTSIYRKPTFSGVFSNFNSFIPTVNKHVLIMVDFIMKLLYLRIYLIGTIILVI